MQKKNIRFFRHTADVEFEVYGKTLPKLLEATAFALFDVMTDASKVKPTTRRGVTAKGPDLEALLYDFLEQFIILHDAENLVFSKFRVTSVTKTPDGYAAKAEGLGEEFDEERHEGRTGIKAVTYHDMKVGRKGAGWFAHVVLDI